MRLQHFVAVSLALAPLAAPGALVSYSFSGTITEVNDTAAPLGDVGGISVGDTFTGTFQFETADAGADLDADPNRGLYFFTGSVVSSITATIDGLTFSAGPGVADIRNNTTSTLSNSTDFLNYAGGALDVLPPGWSFSPPAGSGLQVAFIEAAGTNFSGDALPTSFDPGDWDFGQLFMSFTDVTFPGGTDSNVQIIGDIVLNPAAVPEPSVMLLLGLAGFGTAACRWWSGQVRAP